MPANLEEVERGIEQPGGRRVAATVAVSILGWSLDLFDLFAILYLAPTIAPLFFPSNSPTLSLAGVFGAFAVTLLMRPVGSALFGAYADRHGRRRPMAVAVVSVGIVTGLMGAVPTIEQIGVAAPVIFLLLRLVQGILVGGVAATTGTIGMEVVAARWRGLLSGVIGVAAAALAGLLAAGIFYFASSVFAGPRFAVWGWRVMFFSGVLTSVLGVFIFRSLEESPLWSRMRRQATRVEKAPVRALFSSRYRRTVAVNLAVAVGGATQFYLTSGYLPTFLAVVNHLPKPAIGWILTLTSLSLMLTGSLAGHVSELVGRRKFFLAVNLVNAVLFPLLYVALSGLRANRAGAITALVVAIATLGNASIAAVLVFLNESFPTAVRATGVGVCWNVGFAIGGMTTTFATAASVDVEGITRSVLLFLEGAVIIYLLGALAMRETRGRLE